MDDATQLVLVICGAVVTISGALAVIFGALWWLVKPRVIDWTEEHILTLLRESHHQLTVNHHSSAEPTVLDKLDEVKTEQRAQRKEVESLHANVTGLTHVVIEHLRSASD